MTTTGGIGVLGGTFDPPHVGHRIAALDVREALGLDRLIIVPAARPPHRSTVLPAAVRLDLVRKAFAGDPGIEVSDVEFGREGPSYMVDTLERIREVRPAEPVWLVIGIDQYEAFKTWRRPERILELARLAVMRRAGRSGAQDPRFPFRPVDVTRVDVSATQIRRRLSEGRGIRYLVPEAIVADVRSAWEDVNAVEQTTGHGTRC
ncbi:MAG: nicotinate (nicotinamide) nucleotide adenylyltransferase [Gemmatimonadota bacterium]